MTENRKKIELNNLQKKLDNSKSVVYLSFTDVSRTLGQQGLVELLESGKKVYLSIPNAAPIRLTIASVD
jgi:hypothetical protein